MDELGMDGNAVEKVTDLLLIAWRQSIQLNRGSDEAELHCLRLRLLEAEALPEFQGVRDVRRYVD